MNGLLLPYEITQVLNTLYRQQNVDATLIANWDAYFTGITTWLEQRKAFLLSEQDEVLWENAWVAVEDFLQLVSQEPTHRNLVQAAYDLEDAFQHFYQATQKFYFLEIVELDDLLRLGLAYMHKRASGHDIKAALIRAQQRVEPIIKEFKYTNQYPQEITKIIEEGIGEWNEALQLLSNWDSEDRNILAEAMRYVKTSSEVLIYLHRWQNHNDSFSNLPVPATAARRWQLLGQCLMSQQEVENQLIPDLWSWWQHQRERLLINPELAWQFRQIIDELWELKSVTPTLDWLRQLDEVLGLLKAQSLNLESGYGTSCEILLVALQGASQGCLPDMVLSDLVREFQASHPLIREACKYLRRYLKTSNHDYLYYALATLLEACLDLAGGEQVLQGRFCHCCLNYFDDNSPLCINGKPHSYLELCA